MLGRTVAENFLRSKKTPCDQMRCEGHSRNAREVLELTRCSIKIYCRSCTTPLLSALHHFSVYVGPAGKIDLVVNVQDMTATFMYTFIVRFQCMARPLQVVTIQHLETRLEERYNLLTSNHGSQLQLLHCDGDAFLPGAHWRR
jgi:hypothetical protein